MVTPSLVRIRTSRAGGIASCASSGSARADALWEGVGLARSGREVEHAEMARAIATISRHFIEQTMSSPRGHVDESPSPIYDAPHDDPDGGGARDRE